ncbi:MAG: glycosyltransferase [Aggregatilineales bacterium]
MIFAVALLNALLFPRLRPAPPKFGWRVSVLIPARNESAVIGQTVRMLLRQTRPPDEILVLDDSSDDGTAECAQTAAEGHPALRVITGTPLPAGWMGKNWACHQLAQAASGELLVFIDADVIWQPNALAALTAQMQTSRADLLTVWPTQRTESWAERLVVPLIALAVLGYLPLPLVHHTPFSVAAAANGQCMVFRRSAYDSVGGHAAVRNQIVEDVALARRVKRAGLRLRMADGAGLVACRMYRDWSSVRSGFGKNILAGHGNSLLFLAVSTAFHWIVFVLPWLWLAFNPVGLDGWPWLPLLLIVLGVGARAVTAAATRQRAVDALLLPVSVVMMTLIAAQAVWWKLRYGGPQWKGRTVVTAPLETARHG